MSFCVSHRTALDKNIRHIYSGFSTDVRFRNYSNSADAAMDIHDRIWERHKRPPNRFETKFQEYNPDYKTRMPRAPAFRQANAEEVHNITSRLTRPTLMTVLRQQPAVTSRASSRSPGATSGRTTERSGSETPDVRHRKISYKEWSDDGSDVYYIDDSFLEDSLISHVKAENSGDIRNKYCLNEERETFDSYNQQPHEKDFQNMSCEENHNIRSSNHQDYSESENDMGKMNDDKYEKPETISSQSEISTSENEQRKGQSPKQKLNILEEIIQTKNQVGQKNSQAKKTSSPSRIEGGRKLENRGRINNRISRSPYSEPTPCLGSKPMRHHRQGSSTKTSQTRTPSPGVKMSVNSDYRKSQEYSSRRPQTQASTTRPRPDPVTSQYRSDLRGVAVYLRPTRSKSAPGYKIHDDRRGIPKKREIHANRNGNNRNTNSGIDSKAPSRQSYNSSIRYTKSENELEECTGNGNSNSFIERVPQSRRTQHQSSKSAKVTTANRETSWCLAPLPAEPRSQSVMAARPIEVSKRHSPRNPDDLRYTSCCIPAVENDLLVRFGVQPKGQRQFYVSNSSRRYASAAEMEAASRRLMTPTAAQMIRDRMRWAPNNDNDLEDPVRVIRETVARKSRKRKSGYHNGTAWDSIDTDSDEQRQEEEGPKNNCYRADRLTDKEAGGRGNNLRTKERESRNFPDGRRLNRNKTPDDRDNVNHHDNDKTNPEAEKVGHNTIDFRDRNGAAAVTKQRIHDGESQDAANTSRANRRSRTRSISPSSKSRSSVGSRSTSASRSSNSRSPSRSRSRSTSASKSKSRSRSRSRSAHRSIPRERSSRSRSSERSSSPLVSGEYIETELESSDEVKPKVSFEANADTLSSEEERRGEVWTPQDQGHESSAERVHSTAQQKTSNHLVIQGNLSSDNTNVIGENPPSGNSSDDHRATSESSPQEGSASSKPLASASTISDAVREDGSHWENNSRTASEARGGDSNVNEAHDTGDERAGDDFFGRGRENQNRGLERGYTQINARYSEDGPNATQTSHFSSGSDGPDILYSVQKGYALEADGGSSYYSTDYNVDATDAEEGTTKSGYHRVTFHDDR